VLVNPLFEAPTKQMRAVLPRDVPFKSMIHNSTQGGALVAAILQGAWVWGPDSPVVTGRGPALSWTPRSPSSHTAAL
jgi:hypothetical protein